LRCRNQSRILDFLIGFFFDYFCNVDPRELYPKPPYSDDKQNPPGVTGSMQPRPENGEETYQGNTLLEGKRALITRADSGIGRAVAIAFAREGADVAISFLSQVQDAEETARIVKNAAEQRCCFQAISQTGTFVRRSLTKLLPVSEESIFL
jgi:hypothetical protein